MLERWGSPLFIWQQCRCTSPASTPGSNAPGAEVLRFLSAHRHGILLAVVLNGLAWCALMPAVFVGLRSLIGGAGRGAATVACVAAGVEAALVVAARRSRALPAAVVLVGVAVVALHAVSAISLARAGAFSPGGIAAAAPPLFAIWMAVVGVSVLRATVPSSATVAVTS